MPWSRNAWQTSCHPSPGKHGNVSGGAALDAGGRKATISPLPQILRVCAVEASISEQEVVPYPFRWTACARPAGSCLVSVPCSPRWSRGLAASPTACRPRPRSASPARGTGPPGTSSLGTRGIKHGHAQAKERGRAENKHKKLIMVSINAPIPTSSTPGHISGATLCHPWEGTREKHPCLFVFYILLLFSSFLIPWIENTEVFCSSTGAAQGLYLTSGCAALTKVSHPWGRAASVALPAPLRSLAGVNPH